MMFQPDLAYELVQLQHTELQGKAKTWQLVWGSNHPHRTLRPNLRQFFFRLYHWVVAISLKHEMRLTDEAY